MPIKSNGIFAQHSGIWNKNRTTVPKINLGDLLEAPEEEKKDAKQMGKAKTNFLK